MALQMSNERVALFGPALTQRDGKAKPGRIRIFRRLRQNEDVFEIFERLRQVIEIFSAVCNEAIQPVQLRQADGRLHVGDF